MLQVPLCCGHASVVAEYPEDQGSGGAGLLLPGVQLEEGVMLDPVHCQALHHRVMGLCMLLMLWLRSDHAQPAGLVLLGKQTWQLCD